jgi:hypothetical protein
VSEAENEVQGALRVHQALRSPPSLASPREFVATVITGLALNELLFARSLRVHDVFDYDHGADRRAGGSTKR